MRGGKFLYLPPTTTTPTQDRHRARRHDGRAHDKDETDEDRGADGMTTRSFGCCAMATRRAGHSLHRCTAAPGNLPPTAPQPPASKTTERSYGHPSAATTPTLPAGRLHEAGLCRHDGGGARGGHVQRLSAARPQQEMPAEWGRIRPHND